LIPARDLLEEQSSDTVFEVELVDSENDLLECHEKSLKAVGRAQRRGFGKDSVVIDYTGGTKNMSVALALAAIDAGCLFSYVGEDRRTRDGVGTVVSGHEVVHANINPWDHWAIRERRQAADFLMPASTNPAARS
jgi:hypothetical protein